MASTHYLTLTLAEVAAGLRDATDDARTSFSALDARQLNWKPDATRWSVAQCLDHLLTSNRLMMEGAEARVTGAAPTTMWQRMPVVPGFFGRTLINSQAPTATRKFTAPPIARPASSDIAADVLTRLIDQHQKAIATVERLDPDVAARTIMTSPFLAVATYSLLDGWRLLVAHNHRHLQQARRVMASPQFPKAHA